MISEAGIISPSASTGDWQKLQGKLQSSPAQKRKSVTAIVRFVSINSVHSVDHLVRIHRVGGRYSTSGHPGAAIDLMDHWVDSHNTPVSTVAKTWRKVVLLDSINLAAGPCL